MSDIPFLQTINTLKGIEDANVMRELIVAITSRNYLTFFYYFYILNSVGMGKGFILSCLIVKYRRAFTNEVDIK